MRFNYRVVKHPSDGSYGVHEVYYDEAGVPLVLSEAHIVGNDAQDLTLELDHMRAALTKPVLDYDTRKEIGPAIK